ncbi:MAG: enoyl-CoA hydratase/isomerase family protein [Desulfatiglandaceae bacterium]
MGSYETLRFEQSDETVTVTLHRPKLNLFNTQMIEELIQVWHSLRNNTSARFVILTGQGDHFSAGADLSEFGSGEFRAEDARIHQLAGHELIRSLESLEQVTFAALRGIVCGAGMAVAQACDFRIMTEDSYYIVPETNIGTYYTWGCTPRLVRMVGASKAMEIIMTCDPIPAEEAYRLNLANKVVPNDSLMQATHEFIEKIASKSPTCIRLTKKIALGASMEGFGNMFICEPELMQEVVYTGETNEGIEAFLQKRPPKFRP